MGRHPRRVVVGRRSRGRGGGEAPAEEPSAKKARAGPAPGDPLTTRLQSELSAMALLPVEDVPGIKPLCFAKALVEKAAQAQNVSDIGSVQGQWDRQKVLVMQLMGSLRTPKNDLIRENRGHDSRIRKIAEDARQHRVVGYTPGPASHHRADPQALGR